jgi:hypothetical protein
MGLASSGNEARERGMPLGEPTFRGVDRSGLLSDPLYIMVGINGNGTGGAGGSIK